MKKIQNKKGFTLIELLVVITIIGILAVGGVSVFTKQLQGARDTTRTNNIKLLETANNQYFFDNQEFPDGSNSGAYKTAVQQYVTKYPEEPKPGKTICYATGTTAPATWSTGVMCGAWYGRANDTNGLTNARYKLGTTYEKEENAKKLNAASDGGTILGLYEVFGGEGGSGTTFNTQLY